MVRHHRWDRRLVDDDPRVNRPIGRRTWRVQAARQRWVMARRFPGRQLRGGCRQRRCHDRAEDSGAVPAAPGRARKRRVSGRSCRLSARSLEPTPRILDHRANARLALPLPARLARHGGHGMVARPLIGWANQGAGADKAVGVTYAARCRLPGGRAHCCSGLDAGRTPRKPVLSKFHRSGGEAAARLLG